MRERERERERVKYLGSNASRWDVIIMEVSHRLFKGGTGGGERGGTGETQKMCLEFDAWKHLSAFVVGRW